MTSKAGRKATNQLALLVAGHNAGEPLKKVTELTLQTRKTAFEVGETAKILALLPEGWGETASRKGRLYVTVASNKVFETRSMPVIILTGRSGAENVVKCMTEGKAKDYIVKPFTSDDFLKKINTALMDKIDRKVKKALDEKDKK